MNEPIKERLQKELFDTEVSTLNILLGGEMSAVDSYDEAIHRVRDAELIPTLVECRESHALRAERLRQRLIDLGAHPKANAGIWGGIAKIAEAGASIVGDRAAIAILAGGEEYGLDQYTTYQQRLDSESSKLVEDELLPEQMKTQRTLSVLSALLRKPKWSS
ncbi:MAG TPA: DUF2383 domain-containing protein [Candidatus Obscuribacterales bacterium]